MADTATVVAVVTLVVVIVKVAVVAPAVTVTLDGVWAEALLSDNVTTASPAGAGPVSVTVPVDETPPTTEVGLRLRVSSEGGLIVNTAFCVPLKLADIVTGVALATAPVLTVKVALVVPALMVTLAGV